MPPSFQRARKPEEKELRRRAILGAARALTKEVGAVDFSLSELARRSRVSKPNVYRYFESREEVLLSVWVEEVRELEGSLARRFARCRRDVRSTARATVDAFAAQPLLGELSAIVSTVLEPKLSVDAIVRAKRTLVELVAGIASVLHAQLPWLALADCAWAASAIAIYVSGIWVPSHPSPSVREAFELPELAALCPSFERDFERYLVVLLAGLRQRE